MSQLLNKRYGALHASKFVTYRKDTDDVRGRGGAVVCVVGDGGRNGELQLDPPDVPLRL